MALFKRRTTKSVGKEVGGSLKRIQRKEKILRTLETESKVRKREEDLAHKIRTLKSERPTLFKKLVRGVKVTGDAARETKRQIQTAAGRRAPAKRRAPVRRRRRVTRRAPARRAPVRRRRKATRRRAPIRRAPARRAPARRAPARRPAPVVQKQSTPIGFEGFLE